MPFRPCSKPSLVGAVAAALPIFSETLLTGKEEMRARARACTHSFSFSWARIGRGGRSIKYGDRGGVWRLRMRATIARGEGTSRDRQRDRREREGKGRESQAGEQRREGTGRQKEATSAWRTVRVVRATVEIGSPECTRLQGAASQHSESQESLERAGVIIAVISSRG
jgi:hypothetical protein